MSSLLSESRVEGHIVISFPSNLSVTDNLTVTNESDAESLVLFALKLEKKKAIQSIAVEPVESPVITAALKGEPLKPGPHKIQGIGAGFIPDNLDLSLVDEAQRIGSDEAIEMAQRLHREEGITCGISCGAAVAAAVKVAARPENKGKLIVVILPDSGDRYHSSILFQSIQV